MSVQDEIISSLKRAGQSVRHGIGELTLHIHSSGGPSPRTASRFAASVSGEVTLTDGVDELIRGEQAFEEMYDSSV